MDSYLEMASRVNMGSMSHTSPQYVKIWESTNSTDPVEVPLEKDGTLLISTIIGQFPNTVGLRFWSDTGAWRGLKSEENIIYAPPQGWGNTDYYVVLGPSVPLKRGNDAVIDGTEGPLSKTKRKEVKQVADAKELIDEDMLEVPKLVKQTKNDKHMTKKKTEEETPQEYIIQGIPYTMTEDDLKNHFEEFGELESVKVMRDRGGKSRGFAFLLFKTLEGDKAAKEGIHIFNHRRYWLLPSRKKDVSRERVVNPNKLEKLTKLFVGRIPHTMDEVTIRNYFSKFGVLKDVYIPQPRKGYGFVQYRSKEIADKVLEETHVVDGTFLNVSYPTTEKKSDIVEVDAADEQYYQQSAQPMHMRIHGNGRPGILGIPGFGRMGNLGAPWERINNSSNHYNNITHGDGNRGRGGGMRN